MSFQSAGSLFAGSGLRLANPAMRTRITLVKAATAEPFFFGVRLREVTDFAPPQNTPAWQPTNSENRSTLAI